MNMISTGAFLNEMDASNKQPTVAEKFAAVWEKKNAKAARAGGVSLMALSLAACGSSSTTTTSTDTSTDTSAETTTTTATFSLTTLADLAGETSASNGSLTSEFRFTDGDETVNAVTVAMTNADALIDGSTTDSDTLNITSLGSPASAMTAVNIENVNITYTAGTADIDVSSFSGEKVYNITGSVAGEITGAGATEIAVSDYTRIVTVDSATMAGTTAAGTAETINLSVSGVSYGSTAATRSGVTLTNTTAGTLETLNITSNGSAANEFALDSSDADISLSTVNLLGAADVTVRVSHNDITGVTVVGTDATGDTSVRIDRQSDGTTATNVSNFSGVDNIIVADDASTPAAALVLASVADGQSITVVDDMASSSSITVKGATVSSQAASLSITLDNATASADTDIGGDLSIQNVAALTLTSNGNASSSTEASAENAVNIDGDFTSITINGDTTVDTTMKIDGAGTAETTARTVVVDASGMTSTARLELDTDSNSYVTYTVTGTDNNDTIVAGGTLNGGAGNDSLTGLTTTADTIDGGAGTDTVVITGGADTVTLGAGNDTIDLNVTDVTVVAGVDTITIASAWAAGDTVAITVAGTTATYSVTTADVSGEAPADLIAIEDSLVNFINQTFSGVTAANGENATLTLTYDTDIDATVVSSVSATTAGEGTATMAETIAGTDAVAVATEITDFAAGDKINVAEFIGGEATDIGTAISYFEGDHDDIDSGTSGADNVLVLTDTSYATAAAAQSDYDTEMAAADTDLIVVYLNSTSGVAELVYDNDIKGTGSTDLEALMTFSNITTLTDLAAAFSDATFVV